MSKTLEAMFDGEVLRPDDKTGLQPNTRYRITVEQAEDANPPDASAYPLSVILELATDMGVTDLAARHDHYAHSKLEEHDDSAG